MIRKMKNIIMISLIIILGVLAFFTVSYFRNRDMVMPRVGFSEFGGEMGFSRGERPTSPNKMEFAPEGRPNLPDNMGGKSGEREFRPNAREAMRQEINRMPKENNLVVNILVAIETLGIALIFIYLIMSKFNELTIKETFNNVVKIIIYIVVVAVLTTISTVLIQNFNKVKFMPSPFVEEEVEKDTKATDVKVGKIITEENINLAEYDSNITITKAGSYTLKGEYKHSVLVNADGEVILNLNNVIVTNNITAAIANISRNSLVINLPEGTTNILTDGGSSEYDACIYSEGPITINGTGSLGVYGYQVEGEGIATQNSDITINGGDIKIISNDDGINTGGDGGRIEINSGTVYIKASGDGIDSNKDIVINGGSVYAMGSSLGGDAGLDADEGITINGGDVIALGSDMLEKPKMDSEQKFLAVNLPSTVEEGEIVSIKNEKGEEITSFKAGENFRTLIISNDKIKDEKYVLYKNGEKVVEI